MIKLYLMLRIKNIVYSSFVFLLIKFQKSFTVKKTKTNKGVLGRVVWDDIFVVFLKYIWVKKCVKMYVSVFEMWKLLLK